MGILVVAAGVIFLLGWLGGTRFAEIHLTLRERRLAGERRELRRTADAIHAYRQMDRALVGASGRMRRDAVPDADVLAAAGEFAGDRRPPHGDDWPRPTAA
jgi:hypothetical protein